MTFNLRHLGAACFRTSLLGFALAPLLAFGQFTAPEKLDDGWETATPASAHLDEKPLQTLDERLRDGTYKNIHSMLLMKQWLILG